MSIDPRITAVELYELARNRDLWSPEFFYDLEQHGEAWLELRDWCLAARGEGPITLILFPGTGTEDEEPQGAWRGRARTHKTQAQTQTPFCAETGIHAAALRAGQSVGVRPTACDNRRRRGGSVPRYFRHRTTYRVRTPETCARWRGWGC